MEQNPYAPSQVSPTPAPNTHEGVVITPVALKAVTGTQFWVKFIGVILFIIAALQIISIAASLKRFQYSFPLSATLLLAIPIISMIGYTILATRLMQYGKAITALSRSRDPLNFERAMEVQTKYWKLLGILTIVMMALMVFGIVAMAISRTSLFF